MRLSTIKYIFSSSLLFTNILASTIPEHETTDQSSKYVILPFNKLVGDSYEDATPDKKPHFALVKRDGSYENVAIKNEQSFYSVELLIGTPSQKITVLVDTGSSDLWIMGSDNPYCASTSNGKNVMRKDDSNLPDGILFTEITVTNLSDLTGFFSDFSFIPMSETDIPTGVTSTNTVGGPVFPTQTNNIALSERTIDCSQYGTFDKNQSSTFQTNFTSFLTSYGDSTFASGTWAHDVLNLGGLNITGLSFAVANMSNSTVGVLGIGLPGLETTYSGSTSKLYQYNNFPMLLKQSGAIDSTSYSLFLDDLDAKQGSVLFGAVDHTKYVGNLYTVPMVNILASKGYPNPIQFDVTLAGIGIQNDSKNYTVTTNKFPALLDSGTTISYFPQEVVQTIARQLGARYSSALGFYAMSCNGVSSSTNFVFDFGGFHITGPVSDFLLPTSGNTCVLAMAPQESQHILLGDIFLTHAYVVYDQ